MFLLTIVRHISINSTFIVDFVFLEKKIKKYYD